MRSNAMKKCAIGAMLFGGTLGGVSTAEAGLTWLSALPTNSSNVSYMTGDVHNPASYDETTGSYLQQDYLSATGAASLNSGSVSLLGGSVNWTATGSSGNLSVDIVGAAGVNTGVWVYRWFQVTGTQTVSMNVTGVMYGDLYSSSLQKIWESTDSSSATRTLTAGIYNLRLGYGAAAGETGSGTFVVPAPGAMALLGAVGLVGKRRRR